MYSFYICPNQFCPDTMRGVACLSHRMVDERFSGSEDDAILTAREVAKAYGWPVTVEISAADESGDPVGDSYSLEVDASGKSIDVTPPQDMARLSRFLSEAIDRIQAAGMKV